MATSYFDTNAMIDLENCFGELQLKKAKDVMGTRESLEILITGRPGTGKSTLVNALVGERVAETESDLRVNTKYVTGYEAKTSEGMTVVVWDADIEDSSEYTELCLREMKENCSKVDIILYCLDVSAARSQLQGAEQEQMKDLCAIKNLTKNFGRNWWGHSMFVLTRANALESMLNVGSDLESKFTKRLEDWKKRIHAALKEEGVPTAIVNEVPVKPAGHIKKPNLPGHNDWLSALWFAFTQRAKKSIEERKRLLGIC